MNLTDEQKRLPKISFTELQFRVDENQFEKLFLVYFPWASEEQRGDQKIYRYKRKDGKLVPVGDPIDLKTDIYSLATTENALFVLGSNNKVTQIKFEKIESFLVQPLSGFESERGYRITSSRFQTNFHFLVLYETKLVEYVLQEERVLTYFTY